MPHVWKLFSTNDLEDSWDFIWRCENCRRRFHDVRPKDDVLAQEHSFDLMSRDIAECKGIWVNDNYHPNRTQEK